jgi:5-formyltetrahydrofolate cyclo-ligase
MRARMNNNQFIRQTCQLKRRGLKKTVQSLRSQQVCIYIQQLAIYQEARNIALYRALDGEIDLTTLWIHAINDKKLCYMPVIQPNKQLYFVQTEPGDPTQLNHFKIQEPKLTNAQSIALNQLDLMIMPVVAFDDQGTRIGHGGGYYDRTLARQRPHCLLGAAYSFQRQPHLTREPWDIPMDGIVTENGVYWI